MVAHCSLLPDTNFDHDISSTLRSTSHLLASKRLVRDSECGGLFRIGSRVRGAEERFAIPEIYHDQYNLE